jgi:hypothetical protein
MCDDDAEILVEIRERIAEQGEPAEDYSDDELREATAHRASSAVAPVPSTRERAQEARALLLVAATRPRGPAGVRSRRRLAHTSHPKRRFVYSDETTNHIGTGGHADPVNGDARVPRICVEFQAFYKNRP